MTNPSVAFCIEQTLGHRAHTANIRHALAGESGIALHQVPFSPRRRPVGAPWAVTASRTARAMLRASRWDVAFLHTQSVALFANSLAGPSQRYVVSVDATPVQLDTMGVHYAHAAHPRLVEAAKRTWYRRIFSGAAHVVAWSEWAADSLAADYRVPRSSMTVVHPGARDEFFDIPRPRSAGGPPRVLFVGGDFERKGGPDLLEALADLEGCLDATIVTESPIEPPHPGVTVLHGIVPGSGELLDAFAGADIFRLPTRGDCTPVVLAEAMAAGLPVVTTSIGSNPGIVHEGETGYPAPARGPGGAGPGARRTRRVTRSPPGDGPAGPRPCRRVHERDGQRRRTASYRQGVRTMRVLVTGGAGFIGRHLVSALAARGDRVTVLDNLRRGSFEGLHEMATCIEGDIREPKDVANAMHRAQAVVHLAAQSNVMGSEADRDYTFSTNVTGTWNVLRAGHELGIRHLIFASSREVYGDPERLPACETALLRPRNLYGATKVTGEALVRTAPVPATVLRFGNVIGPGDSGRVLPLWLAAARLDQPLVIYGGSQVLDFVPVGTAVDAMISALDNGPVPHPMNIASGHPTRLDTLAHLVVEALGSSSEVVIAAPRGPEVTAFVADITRMRECLGVQPPRDVFADIAGF
ncbi:MAG: NAD-dependent epimerase/dehydratase family protein [Dehalococcoidia bacterium]|nr:NAD-dependent epimerase/dehydratase family protein [Dehalococcoidia bacterium]